jgi:hypothetical protein
MKKTMIWAAVAMMGLPAGASATVLGFTDGPIMQPASTVLHVRRVYEAQGHRCNRAGFAQDQPVERLPNVAGALVAFDGRDGARGLERAGGFTLSRRASAGAGNLFEQARFGPAPLGGAGGFAFTTGSAAALAPEGVGLGLFAEASGAGGAGQAAGAASEISAVPLPAGLPLMLVGIAALGMAARRRGTSE